MSQSSEVEMQRMSLLGVGPKSRSLKFLNTKNNIADKYLEKRLTALQREAISNMTALEQSKVDTRLFLTNIQKLEEDTEACKQLLRRSDDEEDLSPRHVIRVKKKRPRKVRLAQTAPPKMKADEQPPVQGRQALMSGPETQAERDQMLKINRQKSMFIQLPGRGRQNSWIDEKKPTDNLIRSHSLVESKKSYPVSEKKQNLPSYDSKSKRLPEPSAKSLLDVMIGLHALSHVPSRRLSSRADSITSMRSESRGSISRESLHGNHELVAKNFMLQWKNKIANRKSSIFHKIEVMTKPDENHRQSLSTMAMDNVIEEESECDSDHTAKRYSTRFSNRPSMRNVNNLPAITDDSERMEVFLAWIHDEREKKRKSDAAYVNPRDKLAVRRESFKHWIEQRKGDETLNQEDNKRRIDVHGKVPVIREDSNSPADLGCLMKTMLTIKKKFRDPLDSRVQRFNEQIDEAKKRDAVIQERWLKKREKRRQMGYLDDPDTYLGEYQDDDDFYYY